MGISRQRSFYFHNTNHALFQVKDDMSEECGLKPGEMGEVCFFCHRAELLRVIGYSIRIVWNENYHLISDG